MEILNEDYEGRWIGRGGPSGLARLISLLKPIRFLFVGLYEVENVLRW
jgi:hypothetical protein